METDNKDYENDSEDEIDPVVHSNLLKHVINLNKRPQIEKPSRTEPALEVSEFGLVKSSVGIKGDVNLHELTRVLNKRDKYDAVKRKVKYTEKVTKTLDKPLEKPQADRIRRNVAFEKVRNELNRWEPVITSNRAQTHLTFPIPTGETLQPTTKNGKWRIKSDLQKRLEALEPPEVETYEIPLVETKTNYSMTIQELTEQRKEAAKMRAVQSYQEAKARRQNKIKSKKFHRIQKREKIKQQMKEFELLQKTNPEEALNKLNEIEKARAEERMSLRHKGTGKWAKNKQIRAKYDKESRQALSHQLTISKELTQKMKNNTDSDDEEMENVEIVTPKNDENNPWVGDVKTSDIDDFISGYRKFWDEKNKETENQNEKTPQIESKSTPNEDPTVKVTPKVIQIQRKVKKAKAGTDNWNVGEIVVDKDGNMDLDGAFDALEVKLSKKVKLKLNEMKKSFKKPKIQKRLQAKTNSVDLTIPKQVKRPIIDEELEESTENTPSVEKIAKNELKTILQEETKEKREILANIDPGNVVKMAPTKLNTNLPDLIIENDNEEEHMKIISEAFEDDDIVEDFEKDKKDEIDKDKVKDIDFSLPGWGSWTGTGIQTSKRKKRRFIYKFPKKLPRRDDNKGNLVINEKVGKIKSHLVSELPFPFTKVKDFEASVRAPIGNTFVPQSAYRKMVEPAVFTRLGTVIKPMDDNALINK